jgi:hypothetical protein
MAHRPIAGRFSARLRLNLCQILGCAARMPEGQKPERSLNGFNQVCHESLQPFNRENDNAFTCSKQAIYIML